MTQRPYGWQPPLALVASLLLPITVSLASISRAQPTLLANEFNRGLPLPDLRDKLGPIAPSLPVTVKASQFRILNADEDDLWSNGDEPYLFIAAVFADGSTISAQTLSSSSVRIKSPGKTHGNLGTGHKGTGTYSVPAATGSFSASIRPIAGVGTEMGKKLATVALIVVAMDEDGTPTSAMDKARNAFVSTLQQELDKSVRTLKQPDIEAISSRLQTAMVNAVKSDLVASPSGFLGGLLGALDPDDVIGTGVKTVSYAAIESAGSGGIPFSLPFKKSGVHYVLDGRISTP
jgi:hypothetical protein